MLCSWLKWSAATSCSASLMLKLTKNSLLLSLLRMKVSEARFTMTQDGFKSICVSYVSSLIY